MLVSLGQLVGRHAKPVLSVALVAAVVGGVLGASAARDLKPFNSDDPGSESVEARELLARSSGIDPDFDVIVLVRPGHRIRSEAARARVESVARRLRGDPAVAKVGTFYATGDSAMVARDGRSTYVRVGLRRAPIKDQLDAARRIGDRFDGNPQVTVGGRATFFANGNDTASEDLLRVELLAFPLLLLIALWVFRGVVAALLPLLLGAFTILCALLVLRGVSALTDVSVYALNIVTALGLGLAVDYSLLIVSRYREELAGGREPQRALGQAMATAGRTVLFSALTVAAAASSLLVFPQAFLRSIGIGAMLVALIAGIAALTLLPAALALLGPRVNALALRRWRHAADRAARRPTSGGWFRFAQFVMRRPGRIAAVASIALLALAGPSLGMKLTQVDFSVVPESSSDRRVHEALESEFAPRRTSPITLAVRAGPAAHARPRLERLVARIRRLEGVEEVSSARPLAGRAWRIDVVPSTDPLSAPSERLVRHIRSIESPDSLLVGGESASLVDLRSALREHLPLAGLILFLATALSIFLLTGSLVLPVKAFLMNLLTISAVFGVLVVVFQGAALESLLGYTSSGALEASTLLLIFAISFGLVTDYGIFMLARIKEERDTGVGDTLAVAAGLERTGRVISAAAMLLCVAFGSLLLARHALVKEFGAGIALAVVIDATVVRALLVPSLMRIFGGLNWWAPTPLKTVHERLFGRAARPAVIPSITSGAPVAMEEYMAVTRYCDWDHPWIQAAAQSVVDPALSRRQNAVRLFEFVRDCVLYRFVLWGIPASQTLATWSGTCTGKANLLVALFRASDIPAAYGVMRVNSQKYYGPVGLPLVVRHFSSYSVHINAAAYLDGRWVRCDPSTDPQVALKTQHFCHQTQLIEWDGVNDSIDFLDPGHVYAKLGLRPSIDDLLEKPPRAPKEDLFAVANDYVDFIRSQPPFQNEEELFEAYQRHLNGGPLAGGESLRLEPAGAVGT